MRVAFLALMFGCARDDFGPNDPPLGCPSEEPVEGSACTTIGASCHYHGLHTSSFCTSGGTWQRRVLTAEPGTPPVLESLDDYVHCGSIAGCPEQLCMKQCCGSGVSAPPQGAAFGGCVLCCVNKPCAFFAAKDCPLTQCALVADCAGVPLCAELILTEPNCAFIGYSPSQVGCCQGLVPRCREPSSLGNCGDQGRASPSGERAACLACGDGTCETAVENTCNCPEDCR